MPPMSITCLVKRSPSLLASERYIIGNTAPDTRIGVAVAPLLTARLNGEQMQEPTRDAKIGHACDLDAGAGQNFWACLKLRYVAADLEGLGLRVSPTGLMMTSAVYTSPLSHAH